MEGMSGCQDFLILAAMALGRADITDTAVTMIDVVPAHEAGRPGTRLVEIGETFGGKLGLVLDGAKQRLGISVAIADPGARVRGFDPPTN